LQNIENQNINNENDNYTQSQNSDNLLKYIPENLQETNTDFKIQTRSSRNNKYQQNDNDLLIYKVSEEKIDNKSNKCNKSADDTENSSNNSEKITCLNDNNENNDKNLHKNNKLKESYKNEKNNKKSNKRLRKSNKSHDKKSQLDININQNKHELPQKKNKPIL